MVAARKLNDFINAAMEAEKERLSMFKTKEVRHRIVKSLYVDLNPLRTQEIIKAAENEQEKYIGELRKKLRLAKPRYRRKVMTKVEKTLKERIDAAQVELFRMKLLRSQIILMEGTPGSISHCRNILRQVIDALLHRFKEESQKDIQKDLLRVGRFLKNFKEQPWKFQYVFAQCIYVYALSFRYGRAAKISGELDVFLQKFQDCISDIEKRTGVTSPKWISELFFESWCWQIVQGSRRGAYWTEETHRRRVYERACKEFLELQGATEHRFRNVCIRAMVQYSFVQAYKLNDLEKASDYLDRANQYPMSFELRFIWLLAKVYCQKKLGRKDEKNYRDNVTNLNRLLKSSGDLAVGNFSNEIELLKKL